jgi:hypothetical protein
VNETAFLPMKNEKKAKALIKRGYFIAAVKLIRDSNKTGLKEAKDFCDTLVPAPKAAKIKDVVMLAIESERTHQLAKWPGHDHTVAEWLLILEKLMVDARREWVTGHGDNSALHEVRQIATTAIACMEQCGSPRRGEPVVGRRYPS